MLCDTREEVDELLDKAKRWREKDDRVRIVEFEKDLVQGPVTVHVFYVKYLLPILFDVQVIEHAPGSEPKKRWQYTDPVRAGAGGRRRTRARGSPRPTRRRTTTSSTVRPATASSICRCDASGSCQPVSNPSTAVAPRSGVTTTSVQPSPACTTRCGRRPISSARTTVVPIAITRPPSCRVSLMRSAVVAGTRYHSGYGCSLASSDDTPVCSTSGVTPTPFATSRVTSSGVNGRPALGISALPGSRAYTFWYTSSGQSRVDVAVADRPAVDREVGEHRLREFERRDPQARRRSKRGSRCTMPPPTAASVVARRVVEPRLGRAAVGPAQLDQPLIVGQPLRQVDDERRAVVAQRVERGGQRARRVHDDEVAFVEELRKIVRVRVHDGEIVAVRHQHAHRVARDAARFGRFGGFAHDERGHGVTPSKSADAVAAARRSRSCRRCSSAGTTVSRFGAIGDVFARERVLMHLRAHVAGVERVHAHVGFFGAEDVAELFERGLRRSVPAPAFVRLDRGVGRDVHDRAVVVAQRGQARRCASARGATVLTS